MRSPFLPSSGSPRRCEECGDAVLVKEGIVFDDTHQYRGQKHEKVCMAFRAQHDRARDRVT